LDICISALVLPGKLPTYYQIPVKIDIAKIITRRAIANFIDSRYFISIQRPSIFDTPPIYTFIRIFFRCSISTIGLKAKGFINKLKSKLFCI
jgi:hypothetical protein